MDIGEIFDLKKLGDREFVVLLDYQVQVWALTESNGITFKIFNRFIIDNNDVRFFTVDDEIMLASNESIYTLESKNNVLEFEEGENPFGTRDILTVKAGVYQKQLLIYFEDKISDKLIFVSID